MCPSVLDGLQCENLRCFYAHSQEDLRIEEDTMPPELLKMARKASYTSCKIDLDEEFIPEHISDVFETTKVTKICGKSQEKV